MTSVETLLSEYISEHRSGGEADPGEYLARAAPGDRPELATLIDGYLSRVPRTPIAEQPAPDPRAAATVEAISRSIGGTAGLWPALLPRLRDRAGLKRRELVHSLAAALSVSDREPKVEHYYHEMELGLLPASGVSERVLEALAKLIGSTASELRDAGATLSGGITAGTVQAEAFARTVSIEEPAATVTSGPAPDGDEPWDEVDELFRAGG